MSRYCNVLKVLIVDDEYWIRENIKSLIEWNELHIELVGFAENGQMALKALSETKVDIVITDVNMPVMNGSDFIAKAKELYPEMVFVAISGYSDFKFVRSALIAGAIDYLLKPIAKADLNKIMMTAIEQVESFKDKKIEDLKAKENIKIASSVVFDREFSRMLHENSNDFSSDILNLNLQELELRFAGFVMILVRINDFSKVADKNIGVIVDDNADFYKTLEKQIYTIKEQIKEELGDNFACVFNNAFKMEEFIIITNVSDDNALKCSSDIYKKLKLNIDSDISILISDYYFSFSQIVNAYKDICVSAMMRKFGDNDSILCISSLKKIFPSKRVSSEQEKQIEMSVMSKNRDLFKKVVYEDINLKRCLESDWCFAEIRQLLELISWILRNGLIETQSNEQQLVLDNLSEILRLSVEKHNTDEIFSVLEQMQDEVFKQKLNIDQHESVSDIVAQIKDYVDCCYTEEISLINLSKNFNIDSSYLSKVFKQVSGDNLMLYISKKRVSKAKEYLRNSSLNITEISSLVGYSDYGYFSRVFKKIIGISPSSYREKGD